MLGEMLLNKKKISLNITKGISRYTDKYYEEVEIWDDEFLRAYCKHNQQVYLKLTKDNIDGRYDDDIKKIAEELILLSSNSFNNLNFAIQLSKSQNNYILKALEALKNYNEGNKEEAFNQLSNFMVERRSHINHYLINKTFGILLYEKRRYVEAIDFLTIAVEKKAIDIEVYKILKDIYSILGMVDEYKVIDDIINIIGEA